MSDKLRDDPFWRERIINFTKDAIFGYRKLSPISNFERKILERIEDIRFLDKEIDGGLIPLLTSASNFIPPSTSLRLLMYWLDKKRWETGYEIIYFAARDEISLSEEEITTILNDLKKDPEMNVSWLMAIMDTQESIEEIAKPKLGSSLNLPTDFR